MASCPSLCHRGTTWLLLKQSFTQTSVLPVRCLLQFSFKVDLVWVFANSTDIALCCTTWQRLLAFGSISYPGCILSLHVLLLLFSLSDQAWRQSFPSSPLAGQCGGRVARYEDGDALQSWDDKGWQAFLCGCGQFIILGRPTKQMIPLWAFFGAGCLTLVCRKVSPLNLLLQYHGVCSLRPN